MVQRWQRNGQHRLYVKDTDTRAQLGYYDVRTGKLSVKDDARSYEIVSVLRPFLSGSVPEGLLHLMPQRPATPAEVLAGTEGYETFSASAPRPRTRGPRRITPWRGSRGERIVGRRLAGLGRDGWDVLRAVEEHGGDEIEHLVIGPPGVFTINTLHHRGARIRVGSQVVWVDDSIREYLRNARIAAASVTRRLGDVLGDLVVPVIPVLAFVDAAGIDAHDGHPDVLVVAGERLDAELRDCRGELSLPERDRIVAAAHRAGLWTI
ncbi:nuclease-related domain-containing protein [Actinospica sp.]|uniref:nuclease-related domain-containing protein n=1 Tax=Actinospica sp. TaxID=1872142 RepID=UPI002C7B57E4|nr:nuclease-related domain-containing protein [Actinospica sp.]HWG23449.1 nuclease-related domain-containing protein [Actinospica sp.]